MLQMNQISEFNFIAYITYCHNVTLVFHAVHMFMLDVVSNKLHWDSGKKYNTLTLGVHAYSTRCKH